MVLRNKTSNRERVLVCFIEVDNLPVCMGLKGCKSCKKINGFQDRGLALRIITGKQNNLFGKVNIQTGELAEVGEGKMFEVHISGVVARSKAAKQSHSRVVI
jgi:hypothetical protein